MTDTDSVLDQGTLATIDRWLAYRVWHTRTPGAQVAVGHRGKLLFSRAYGYADLAGRQRMRTDHLFRVASHSKTFTATLILQLVERERLALDDRLRDHLPELAEAEIGDTRIRELLEHTAGALRDGADGDFWQGTRPFPDRTELVAMVSTVKRPPGELFAYSNLGYGLLGAVIESVTGDRFEEAVQRHIGAPLDLTNTTGTYRPDRAGDYATGYSSLATGLRRHRIDPVDTRALDAAAGVTSTAEDLVSYFSAHALGDTRLITDRSKRLMQRTANLADPRRPDGPGYGLGMASETFGEHRMVGHGGGFPGHITRTLVDADDGLVVTALTNAIDGPASQLAAGVLKLVDDARSHPPDGPGFGPEVLAHTGRWRNLWSVVDIGVLGHRLLAIDPTRWEPVEDVDELEAVAPDRFRIRAGGGYGAVGEPVVFAEDRTVRYGPMTFVPLDALPEQPDAPA